MMWIIIGAVLAILVLVIYSFITGGVVRRFTSTIFRISDDSDQRMDCMVGIGGQGDTNGDGIRDDDPACLKYGGKGDG